MDSGGDVGSEPEEFLTSKPDGGATRGLGKAATSAHRVSRAKAVLCSFEEGERMREGKSIVKSNQYTEQQYEAGNKLLYNMYERRD